MSQKILQKKIDEIARLRKNSGKFCRNYEKVFETSKKNLVNLEVFINLE